MPTLVDRNPVYWLEEKGAFWDAAIALFFFFSKRG